MPRDPFINNKVVLQLIQTPPASHRAMDVVAHGAPVQNKPQTRDAVTAVRGWLFVPLKDEFRPAEDIALLAFPREGGVCDAIRAAYSAGGFDIETAQSRYIVSYRLNGQRRQPGATDLARAQSAAKLIFQMDDHLNFVELESSSGRTWGMQSPTHGQRLDPEWPHWHDSIHWWATADEMGFLTVKALGGPTREVIGVFPEMNVTWFAP